MDKQVADTSIAAYQDLLPTLGKRAAQTLDDLRAFERQHDHWPTAYELARWKGHADPNYYRPRLTELSRRRDAPVRKGDKRTCAITRKIAYTWSVVYPERLF